VNIFIANTKDLTSPNLNFNETQDYLKWVTDEWNKDSLLGIFSES